MKFAKILATGCYLPDNVVTNFDLAQILDTSDEWIVQRTGIKQRHIASEDDNVVSMGVASAKQALARANCQAQDIDMVVVATCTADKIFPSVACLIQQQLGIGPGPAFDVQAACSGFIYAVSVATQFISSNQARRVLVVGTEVMSRVVDWKDRGTCVLFGDGAGALILEQTNTPGILSTHLSSDGRYKDILFLNNARDADDPYLRMEGSSVFKWAVKWLGEVALEAIEANNLTADDIDWIVPHQANIRIIQATAKKLGLPMSKVVVTVDKHANTSAASIPTALDTCIRDGRVQRGQRILLEAFGGGLTWGSVLIRY